MHMSSEQSNTDSSVSVTEQHPQEDATPPVSQNSASPVVASSSDKQEVKPPTIAGRFRGYYPVVIDVETAGFNPETDALLEFAAITVRYDDNGKLVKNCTYHANIKPFPNANIVDANVKYIGVDPFDPNRQALTEAEALPPFFKAISREMKAAGCSRAILVGHNGNFDFSFIKAATERIKYKRSPFHQFSVIDTVSLSALMLGQTVLSVSCLTAGIEFDEQKAHAALYDTEKEAELFCYLVNRVTELGGWPLPKEMRQATNDALMSVSYHRTACAMKAAEAPTDTPLPDWKLALAKCADKTPSDDSPTKDNPTPENS